MFTKVNLAITCFHCAGSGMAGRCGISGKDSDSSENPIGTESESKRQLKCRIGVTGKRVMVDADGHVLTCGADNMSFDIQPE